MRRRDVLWVAMATIAMLLVSVLATATMIFWLPVILIEPSITRGIQHRVMHAVTKQMIRGMM